MAVGNPKARLQLVDRQQQLKWLDLKKIPYTDISIHVHCQTRSKFDGFF
jgi:hypothetical protein